MTQAMKLNYHSSHLLEIVKAREPLLENIVSISNVNIRDEQGKNALYWAIQNKSKHNVALLLKYGISQEVSYQKHALFHAIACEDVEVLEQIINFGSNINIKDAGGKSLLMKAIESEKIAIVQYLLNKSIDLYLIDKNYNTALDIAKKCTNRSVFELVHYAILNEQNKEKI